MEIGTRTKIADIGCGSGVLLRQLQACGFNNLYGFDPFINNEIIEDNLQIKKIRFDQISDKFHVVMFHHSMEHMENPDEVFAHLNSILEPKGKVLIRIPVADSEIWQTEGSNWFQLDAPRHLFIPHTKSINILAQKHGFTIEKIEFDSEGNQFWITELYKRQIPFIEQDPQNEFSKKELSNFSDRAKEFNKLKKGDQAAIYLRKI